MMILKNKLTEFKLGLMVHAVAFEIAFGWISYFLLWKREPDDQR